MCVEVQLFERQKAQKTLQLAGTAAVRIFTGLSSHPTEKHCRKCSFLCQWGNVFIGISCLLPGLC